MAVARTHLPLSAATVIRVKQIFQVAIFRGCGRRSQCSILLVALRAWVWWLGAKSWSGSLSVVLRPTGESRKMLINGASSASTPCRIGKHPFCKRRMTGLQESGCWFPEWKDRCFRLHEYWLEIGLDIVLVASKAELSIVLLKKFHGSWFQNSSYVCSQISGTFVAKVQL